MRWMTCWRIVYPPHRVVVALVVWLGMMLGGCTTGKPTLVLLVGGAGLSQLGELSENISASCPDADVVETSGWDGFRADLGSYVRSHPYQGVVLIGHSFGCKTIAESAASMSNVDLAVMIDPAWDDFALPPSIRSCLWYQRAEDGGPERRSTIINGGRPMVVSGDHGEICHSPQIMAQVTQMVRGISARHANQQRMKVRMLGAGAR